jgi:hypothetical protein
MLKKLTMYLLGGIMCALLVSAGPEANAACMGHCHESIIVDGEEWVFDSCTIHYNPNCRTDPEQCFGNTVVCVYM